MTTLVGFAVAGVVVAGLFWLADVDAVLRSIGGADPGMLAMVALLILAWVVAWGLALWQVLQALSLPVSPGLSVQIHAAAVFANHLTPFGQAGGEPITALLLSRRVGAEYEISLASVTSLDAINVIPSLIFAATGATYFALSASGEDVLRELSLIILGVIGIVVATGLVAWWFRTDVMALVSRTAHRAYRFLSRLIPDRWPIDPDAIAARLVSYRRALGRVASNRRRLAFAIGWSAVGWAVQALALWLTFEALGVSIPVYIPFFVVPLGTVASAVPTPGGLGGIESVNVGLLALVTDAALAPIVAAVTIHSVGGYLLTTVVGAVAASWLEIHG